MPKAKAPQNTEKNQIAVYSEQNYTLQLNACERCLIRKQREKSLF